MGRNKKKAAALEYNSTYKAPIVTAAGIGDIADKIVEIASQNDVPVVYNDELAEVLQNVDIGEYIPYDLYDAAAKVIAYVVDIDSEINPKRSNR